MKNIETNSHWYLSSSSRLVVAAFLIVAITALGGCGSKTKIVKTTSTSDLLKALRNLKPRGIESCGYTIETSTAAAFVPSPSDTRLELKGSAAISKDGAKALKTEFEWEPILRADVPVSLLSILPPGDVLVSRKLNKGFEQNPTYRHGFVVALANDNWSRIYFLATDLDHPIK